MRKPSHTCGCALRLLGRTPAWRSRGIASRRRRAPAPQRLSGSLPGRRGAPRGASPQAARLPLQHPTPRRRQRLRRRVQRVMLRAAQRAVAPRERRQRHAGAPREQPCCRRSRQAAAARAAAAAALQGPQRLARQPCRGAAACGARYRLPAARFAMFRRTHAQMREQPRSQAAPRACCDTRDRDRRGTGVSSAGGAHLDASLWVTHAAAARACTKRSTPRVLQIQQSRQATRAGAAARPCLTASSLPPPSAVRAARA